jgi:hypothetical protein
MTFEVDVKLMGAALKNDFKKTFDEAYGAVEDAACGAMHEAATRVLELGRKDIIDSGYGYNWARDLNVRMYPLGGRKSPKPITFVWHAAPNNFAGIPQYGLKIDSAKLMWIPFDAKSMVPTRSGLFKTLTLKRAWLASVGKMNGSGLEYVSPRWKGIGTRVPLLIKKRASHKEKMEPIFFGVHHVEIPKSWHVVEIAEAENAALPGYFEEIFDKKADGFNNA